MRLGLVARADNSGLGTQTWELYRHLHPDKTLIIDLSGIAEPSDHCNRRIYPERFPGAQIHRGLTPTPDVIEGFLADLDVIFSAETFYTHDFLHRANYRKVKSILQYNYEFLAHLNCPSLPAPTLFAAPSLWRYFATPLPNKIHLPVPIATDRFAPRPAPPVAATFLHPVGRPAIYDRNGTTDVLAALAHIRTPVTVIFRCQRPGYVEDRLAEASVPGHVQVVVDTSSPEHYWDNYAEVDAVILPRRYGGLCLPVNEALGAGLPVIMPDIDPNNRWLPPDWLLPARSATEFQAANHVEVFDTSPTALANMIDRLATDSEFYARCRTQAAELAQLYSWDTLLPQYDAALHRVMDML